MTEPLPLLRVLEPGEDADDSPLSRSQFNFDKLAQLFPDFGGRTPVIRFGSGTVTYTASSTSATTTINHGCGRTPVAILLTGKQPVNFYTIFHEIAGPATATQFFVRGRSESGAVTGDQAFYWLAIA